MAIFGLFTTKLELGSYSLAICSYQAPAWFCLYDYQIRSK
jgi:hypothetical protein